MNIDNKLYTGRPTELRSDVEMAIYDKLDAHGISVDKLTAEIICALK